MDATALEVLEKRGLGHLTGVRLGNDVRGCCYLSDHSFTRNVEGFRTLDQLTTKELLSLDDRVEFLGYISESDERTHVYRCISKFENELGGKIIVDTSDPWRLSDDVGRVKLLSSVSKWMGCPYIEWENDLTPSRIQPFVKTDGKKALIMLLNPSTDSSNPFFITLRGKMKDAALIRNDGTEISLEAEALDGALRISVPSVEAWDIATLFAR